jgi:pilus assembly protein CpaE
VSAPIRTLVTIDPDTDRDAVEAVIPVDRTLELVAFVEGLETGWGELGRHEVDVVLVACSGEGELSLSFVDAVVRDHPDRPVIMLSHGSVSTFPARAFAAGAEDVVALPQANGQPASPAERERVAAELLTAVEKAVARRRRAARTPQVVDARMISVVGPKGGAGKTLVSCSLAVALAEAGERVVLVDLDLQFGDVGLALGLPPGKTIYDLVQSGGSLDAEKLSAYLQEHESGARVLLAPARPDQAATVRPEFLRDLFDLLRDTEQWIVVDTSPGFAQEVITAIDAATDLCMVGMLDSLSLKNTKLGLETLELMGVGPERVKLVLNRADSRVGITREDVQAVTGRPPDVLVPSHRDIPRSVNEARPIVRSQPGSDAGRALRSLAELYRGGNGDRNGRRRGLLGRRR